MLFISNRLSIKAFFALSLLSLTSPCFAAYRRHNPFGYGFGYSSGNGDQYAQRLLAKADLTKELQEALRAEEGVLPDSARAQMEAALENLWKPTDYAKLFALSLAGKNSAVIEDCQINGLQDALSKGLIVLGTEGLSNVLNRRIENAFEATIGSLLDKGFNKIIDMCGAIRNFIINNGSTPFTLDEIENWRDMTLAILDDLLKLLKDGLKEGMRGQDFTIRPVLDTDDQKDDLTINGIKEEELDEMWQFLVEGYADQLERMVFVFSARKKCYAESSPVQFWIDKINERVTKLREKLLTCKSLKSFDAALHSNKVIFEAIKKNIAKLFERLAKEEDIQPDDFSLGKKNQTKPNKQNNLSTGLDPMKNDDLPTSFAGGNIW